MFWRMKWHVQLSNFERNLANHIRKQSIARVDWRLQMLVKFISNLFRLYIQMKINDFRLSGIIYI